MRCLAIETSIQPGSIALLQRDEVVAEVQLPAQQRTAQSLAPALAAALAQWEWPASSIQLVAVAHGPGSFTGLRIATTAAKTFAYAVQAQLVALNTLDVIVAQLPSSVADACAVMDAQRGQLFAARYLWQDPQWQAQDQCQIIDRQDLPRLLGPRSVLTGPGLARLEATVAPEHLRRTDLLGPAHRRWVSWPGRPWSVGRASTRSSCSPNTTGPAMRKRRSGQTPSGTTLPSGANDAPRTRQC